MDNETAEAKTVTNPTEEEAGKKRIIWMLVLWSIAIALHITALVLMAIGSRSAVLILLFVIISGLFWLIGGFILFTNKRLRGNHQIYYRYAEDTQTLDDVSCSVPVTFSEVEYVHKKHFLTDTWTLNVGKALETLLKARISKAAESPDITATIKDLSVSEFRKGFWLWSRHSVTVKFIYEIYFKKDIMKSGVIEETGKGRGAEFGRSVFIPLVGVINFDKGIEAAMSRALQKSVGALFKQLSACVTSSP